jgi:hypothetical protein
MSSLANTIRREAEAARVKQAQWEAEAEEREAQEALEAAREEAHASDCRIWADEFCDCVIGGGRKPPAREDVFAAIRSGAYFGLEVKR